jgi:hypothetical protein
MRVWVVALLLVAACGSVSGQSTLPLPTPPTAALALWKNFPAHAKPRPLIVFSRTLEHIGPSGFTSEPDRKPDYGCNKFVFGPAVTPPSDAPGKAIVSGTSYPSIGATRAWAELMAARAPYASQSPQCATSRPFVIKQVRWATAAFRTDRGWTQMPAWLFDFAEIDGYLGYAGLDPLAFWGGAVSEEGRGARISADGRSLKVPVGNMESGPCGFSYTAAAAESDTAVAVAVRQFSHATPSAPTACDLVYRIGYITVTLNAPLGDRVLLDEQGRPGAVCPESESC